VRKSVFIAFFLLFSIVHPLWLLADQTASIAIPESLQYGPNVLVLYDGPDVEANPGRLDALYLANLLGHFTTNRKIHTLEAYKAGEWEQYDAVFAIVYQKHYTVPRLFLQDIARSPRTFCWLGNQVGQLDQKGILRRHGMVFEKFADKTKFDRVFYKNHVLAKGDPETNILRITDPDLAKTLAQVGDADHDEYPYIIQSGSFWVVADSPFSYSAENDRYLAFCDVLHDILGIQHADDHPAILRIEDLNAMSIPTDLEMTLAVIRKHKIPFSFGFVPMYVNPEERTEFRLADKSEVVDELLKYMRAGGVPVLHGYTHQYRGITTDDYEFWDDLSDRPVRGDSEAFATHRITEAIKESMNLGIYPVTWETPHYAASPIDYQVFHRFFNTVFERRLAGGALGDSENTREQAGSLNSDQFFPYPVVDLFGQYVIPESLAYVPIDDQRIEPILEAADAEQVVRDGYASFFFHPFLKPQLLDDLITGIKQRGFHFIDLRSFPNEVNCEGRVVKTQNGAVQISGNGHYLNEYVLGPLSQEISERSLEIAPQALVKRQVELTSDEMYVAMRQDFPAPGMLKKLIQVAKGDFSVLHKRLGTVIAQRSVRNPTKTLMLWNEQATGPEAVDQESFLSAFTNIGFDVEQVDYMHLSEEELDPFTMLVIPQATAKALPQDVVERIGTALNSGITLVTDGESRLSQELGIELGAPIRVSVLQDHIFVNQETRWPDKPLVPWVAEPNGEDTTVYYSDRDTQHPLVISGRQREGRYLFFGPLFDSITGQGYGRFPNLPQILLSELRVTPMAERFGAEAYFDPGYRESISIEVLARMWRRFGIRAIHVAAWHFYDKYTYDYARLVKVAHQNGILVYAWFEWPEVSQSFWDRHPKWREKTALLTDAQVDWRYLMNLQDPQCMKAVLSDLKSFMKKYDWDGVNIGELTFESPSGPGRPEFFTPLNTQARKEFQTLEHFDPIDIFSPASPHYWKTNPEGLKAFYQYRRDTNIRLLETFLDFLQRLSAKQGRSWDIVVTMLDALQHPELSDYIAIDVPRTVAVINQHNATLQVEDPAPDWAKEPDRYLKMGEIYKSVKLNKPFMIDINVLPVHSINQQGFATAQPTGVELVQLWRAASSQASRVCFYAESSVFEHDWEIMPYAMAAHADLKREEDHWTVDTPNTIRLDVGRGSRRFRLDDQPWYCDDKGSVWIPPGEHTLHFLHAQQSWFDTSQLETHLISISGELLGSQRVQRGLDIEYDSPNRCAMMFNKAPYRTYLDDDPIKLSVSKGDDGYTLLAPPGRHRLRVLSETPGLFLVEFTSFVSASLIVLFGLVSSGLLAILILFITINRRTHRIRRLFWRRMRELRRKVFA
jgi:uncharacterized protein YdaL